MPELSGVCSEQDRVFNTYSCNWFDGHTVEISAILVQAHTALAAEHERLEDLQISSSKLLGLYSRRMGNESLTFRFQETAAR